MIVRGNESVAPAFTVHIMDVYDHYRWRWRISEAAKAGKPWKAWSGLKKKDVWRDPYFGHASDAFREIRLWNP